MTEFKILFDEQLSKNVNNKIKTRKSSKLRELKQSVEEQRDKISHEGLDNQGTIRLRYSHQLQQTSSLEMASGLESFGA